MSLIRGRRKKGISEPSERENAKRKEELAFKAIKEGDVILLQHLLRDGLNVNVYRWSGWSLLHRAAGVFKLLNILSLVFIVQPLTLLILNLFGETCINEKENGQTDICDILVEYGAEVDSRTTLGW